MQRKCCVHCPSDVTRTGEPAREHACTVPGYVSGSLRLTSLGANNSNGCNNDKEDNNSDDRDDRDKPKLVSQGSCFERFATAKKFHSENLQHRPLPDRVDDALFTVANEPSENFMCDTVKRCQRVVPRRQTNRKKELSRVHRYAPALGCKKPATYMDLAICWETPINPSYEPRRAAHVDGSDGGPAPAIFALVQREGSQVDVRDGCIIRPGVGRDRGSATRVNGKEDAEIKDELCRNLDSINLTEDEDKQMPTMAVGVPVGAAARKKRAEFLRHCASNVGHGTPPATKKPSRPTRSASCQLRKSNGLQQTSNGSRMPQIPRPRTPYARRSFCIDTLAPPFSVVRGCRDTDYPEHWRLTSIYQQSYRNPRKMREGRTLLTYDRSYNI